MANFQKAILDRWNKEKGTEFTLASWTDWDGGEIFQGSIEWWDYPAQPGFWEELDLIPGARNLVKFVQESGLPWAFLTCLYFDKAPRAGEERANWIEKHFGKEAREHLVICTGQTKSHIVRKGDILIEDRAKYIKEANEAGAKTFCLAYPWNREIKNSYSVMNSLLNALENYVKAITWEPNSYQALGETIGKLVEKKQAAYGNSFSRAGEILKTLYPNGIETEDYQKILLISRVTDKIFRYVTMPDAFGESPWEDIAGYSLLEAMRHRKAKNEN